MVLLVEKLHDWEWIVQALEASALRHLRYGVTPSMFPTVGAVSGNLSHLPLLPQYLLLGLVDCSRPFLSQRFPFNKYEVQMKGLRKSKDSDLALFIVLPQGVVH